MLNLPPCSGLVRGQTEESMKEVHPQRCAEFLVHKPKECRQECCKEPEFGSIPAEVGMGVGLQESRPLHTLLGGADGLGGSNPLLLSTPQSWKWVLAPIILYIFERILRIWRAQQKVVVTKVGGEVVAWLV